MPVVEVHLSNVDEREEWRRRSVIADIVATAVRRARARTATARRSSTSKEQSDVTARLATRCGESLSEPLLVTNLVNVLYLRGFDSSNAALLVEPDGARLFTDFRYIEAARADRRASRPSRRSAT